MEILERYLQAVGKHLPRNRQKDILAELRANMEAQLEDKESELGRNLTQGEAEDWLRAMGPPMLVASRYRPQQYLIGPALFPVYLYILKMAVLWAVIVYAIVNTVRVATFLPKNISVIAAVIPDVNLLIIVAAWVTLAFAALEFFGARYPEKYWPIGGVTGPWSPSSLPPLEKTESDRKPRSYGRAIAEVIFGFMFLVWLLLIPQHPFLLMGPGAVVLDVGPFRLADAWWTFYWWIVVLNALQLAWRTVDLLRGAWQNPPEIQHFVFKIFGLAPIVLMLFVPDHAYVLLRNPAVNQAHYGGAVDAMNKNIPIGLVVITVIASLQLAWDIGKWALRAWNEREAGAH